MAEPDSAEPPVPPKPVAEPATPQHDVDAEPPVPHPIIDAEIVDPSTPTAPTNPINPDYTDAGVPTFTHVRDKIEERIGRAIGSEELAHETPAGRGVQEQWDAREKAAKERLEQIRKSLHKDSGSSE